MNNLLSKLKSEAEKKFAEKVCKAYVNAISRSRVGQLNKLNPYKTYWSIKDAGRVVDEMFKKTIEAYQSAIEETCEELAEVRAGSAEVNDGEGIISCFFSNFSKILSISRCVSRCAASASRTASTSAS